jgi:hypothetical protein
MQELTTTVRPSARPEPRPATVADAPTLITEQQVRFATVAAVAVPRVRRTPWLLTVRGVMRTLFASPQTPAQRHHPQRYPYLEGALMAREMDRL